MPTRKMKINKKEQIKTERNCHNAALYALAISINPANKLSGLQLWRKLRRVETVANNAACHACSYSTPFYAFGKSWDFASDETALDNFGELVSRKVAAIFGGLLPIGYHFNRDPRGYALKLESLNGGTSAATPFELHQDWGRNQILAPDIR